MNYDDALFRQQLPEFADKTTYPPDLIQLQFDLAMETISTRGWIKPNLIQYMANLLTAHQLVYFGKKANQTQDTNATDAASHLQVTATSIDGVSVSYAQPTTSNMADYNLSQTKYGLEFSTLAYRLSRGGKFIGGIPESGNFRHGNGYPRRLR